MNQNRVVVTGLGVICSIGSNIIEFSEGLKQGKSGVSTIDFFDATEYRTNQAAIVKNFKNTEGDKCISLACQGAKQAMDDARININKINKEKAGVAIASSLGCVDALENYIAKTINGEQVNKDQINIVPHNIPSAIIASNYGFEGPVVAIDTACASGSNTVGYAYDQIKHGNCDVMLAGGVDIISKLSLSGFSGLMSLTKTKCQPFDHNRSGLILGEGCAFITLESLLHAQQRNANIYGEVLGYGLSNDAYHDTRPDPNGTGAIQSMNMALTEAGISPQDVDYMNAHGTGTSFNDLMEISAIQQVFGLKNKKLYISSIKAAIGHTLGAAGAIEFVASILAIAQNFIPPTLNFDMPMKGLEELNFVGNKPIDHNINIAISNSFGFAGNCCSIIVSKFRN